MNVATTRLILTRAESDGALAAGHVINSFQGFVAGNRIAQGRLNQFAAGLEELEARILLLDRSLSPDDDDGKILRRLRHRLASDLMQQKQYRSFIAEKDKEARELIDQGIDHLQGIKRIFDERGIEIPFPHQTIYFGEDKHGKAPPLRPVFWDVSSKVRSHLNRYVPV